MKKMLISCVALLLSGVAALAADYPSPHFKAVTIDTPIATTVLPAFAGGDCTSTAGTAILTCAKTGGVAFGYFATGTDAGFLTGTLAAARLPALSGDVSTTAGSAAVTVNKVKGTTVSAGAATALGIAPNTAGGVVTSPVSNANLANSSLTVAGKTVSLGGSTSVDVGDLTTAGLPTTLPVAAGVTWNNGGLISVSQ